MDLVTRIHIGCIAALTVAAIWTDLRYRRIPNWLTVTGAVSAILFHTATSGWAGATFSLGGFAVGFGVLFVLWIIGGGGGGDVKLMGAIGAWMGPTSTFVIFLLSTVFALICIAAIMVWRFLSPKLAARNEPLLKQTIPYAIPAGLASWAVVLAKFATGPH